MLIFAMNLTVSRIALVKPDKARGVEDVLLRAAQTGGISEKVIVKHRFLCPFAFWYFNKSIEQPYKFLLFFGLQVSEERLISLLEQINTQTNKQTKVTVCKAWWILSALNIYYSCIGLSGLY
jgi:programmed cell death protein 5